MNRRLENIIFSFAEFCLRIPLLELASERNSQLDKIRSKSYIINEHLMKYYLMPLSRDKNHWLKEINTWLMDIQYKYTYGKDKLFRKEEYFYNLYSRFYLKEEKHIKYKYIETLFEKIKEKYSKETFIEYNINDYIDRVGIIFEKLSKDFQEDNYDLESLKEYIKILEI